MNTSHSPKVAKFLEESPHVPHRDSKPPPARPRHPGKQDIPELCFAVGGPQRLHRILHRPPVVALPFGMSASTRQIVFKALNGQGGKSPTQTGARGLWVS